MHIKKTKKTLIIILISIIFFTLIFAFSFAWFTKKENTNLDLNFGTVSIACDGGQDGQSVDFKITNANSSIQKTIAMPGDFLTSNFRVKNYGTVDCYYLIKIESDNKNLKNLNKVFSFDGSSLTQTTNDNISLSLLKVNQIHNISLKIKLDEDYTLQNSLANISLKVVAIQQGNITQQEAFEELINL